jgi:predicted nucleic acid-binding Zn ribbon protein
MAAAGMAASGEQRRRVRRSALLWALIAAAFYLGFIVLAVTRGMK